MNKKVILIILINTIFGAGDFPDYGPGQQWTTFGSTIQGFIIFDEINFNDEPIASGTLAGAYGECDENDCDILGLMYNGQCIGWSYLPTSENGQITIAANLKDPNTPQVQGYPNVVPGVYSPIITYNFYDASESIMYYNVGSVVPISGNQINVGILDITGSGDVCSTNGFVFGTPDEYCLDGIGCNSSDSEYFDAIGYLLLTCEGDCEGSSPQNCGYCDNGEDCTGSCKQTQYQTAIDDCDICGGENIDMDCTGVCFGDTIVDECEVCGGSGPHEYYNCDGMCLNDDNDDNICNEIDGIVVTLTHTLDFGNNLIGYNGDDDNAVENLLGNQIDDIRFIVGQGEGTFIENTEIESDIEFIIGDLDSSIFNVDTTYSSIDTSFFDFDTIYYIGGFPYFSFDEDSTYSIGGIDYNDYDYLIENIMSYNYNEFIVDSIWFPMNGILDTVNYSWIFDTVYFNYDTSFAYNYTVVINEDTISTYNTIDNPPEEIILCSSSNSWVNEEDDYDYNLCSNVSISGNLHSFNRGSGYWLNTSKENTIISINNILDNCSTPFDTLIEGNNLVSYYWKGFNADIFEALGGIEYATENFNSIYGAGYMRLNTTNCEPDSLEKCWVGNLNELESGMGYWLNVKESSDILSNDFSWGFTRCEYAPKPIIMNKSFKNKLPEEYQFVQSTEQSFYLITDIENVDVGDIILANCGNQLVGSALWDGALTTIPVMGRDLSEQTIGFCEEGESPQFLLIKEHGNEKQKLIGEIQGFTNLSVNIIDKLVLDEIKIIPTEWSLAPAYPNPFNPVTTINFGIPAVESLRVTTLHIYNIKGQLIKSLINGNIEVGMHTIKWDATGVPSGIYFIKMMSGDFIQTQKVILMK